MEKQIFRTKNVTEVSNIDLEGVGTLRWVGDKLYRWVQNKGVDMTVGQIAFHKAADAAEAESLIYDLYTAGAANTRLMAGVVMAPSLLVYVDSTTKCFGWILVLGDYSAIAVFASGATAIVAGDRLKASATQSTGYLIHGAPAAGYVPTQQALTHNGGGTTSTTIASITSTATSADAVACIAAQLALIKADIAALAELTAGRHVVSLAAVTAGTTTTVAARGYVNCL